MESRELTEAGISPSSDQHGSSTEAPSSTVRKGQRLDLWIEDLAYGGKALAKVDGLVVFVDNALPGDRVMASVYRRRKQYAEARAEQVLTPSPSRVPAPCVHVPVCGGCRFQDFDYEEQLRHKQRQVEGSGRRSSSTTGTRGSTRSRATRAARSRWASIAAATTTGRST